MDVFYQLLNEDPITKLQLPWLSELYYLIDFSRRHILTSNVDPHTVRVKIFIMTHKIRIQMKQISQLRHL